MTVSFGVLPFSTADIDLLKSLATVLTVELQDGGGNRVCSGSGPLSESLRGTSIQDEHGRWTSKHWVLASGREAYFWNAACTGIKMNHRSSYVLTVTLDQIDARSPDATLQPTIEGGGIELP
jgi:hypothetical protein